MSIQPSKEWSLFQWLKHLESIHPSEIDMGLDRVREVYQRLNLSWSKQTVITVAGTNGKGTTCAMLEQACILQNKSVGVYSSPHISIYNERVRINQTLLNDYKHCQAFMAVEKARGDISLTYFEFGTLAALVLLNKPSIEIVLLEVGLGGRLDATNIVDPDIAVITSIGLDHQAFLGNTREAIAREKAGIIRANKPVIIGEIDPPASLQTIPLELNAEVSWAGKDFIYSVQDDSWHYSSKGLDVTTSLPSIPLPNAATALAVIEALQWQTNSAFIQTLIEKTKLHGRLQKIIPDFLNTHNVPFLLDVAHNPQAAQYLAKHLQMLGFQDTNDAKKPKLHAIFGAFKDKDIKGVLEPLAPLLHSLHCVTLEGERAADKADLAATAQSLTKTLDINTAESIDAAYKAILKTAHSEDLVLVFGSFFTVEALLAFLKVNAKH